MANKKESELVSKVMSFVDGLDIQPRDGRLIFCIALDESNDTTSGIMKFNGDIKALTKCFADYIHQKPELGKAMLIALFASDRISESAFNMARKDYEEYLNDKNQGV